MDAHSEHVLRISPQIQQDAQRRALLLAEAWPLGNLGLHPRRPRGVGTCSGAHSPPRATGLNSSSNALP